MKRALQRLQASANDNTILVGSPKMTPPTEKVLKGSKKVSKASKTVGKENAVSSTLPKRKIVCDKQNKPAKEKTLKKIAKSSKSKPKNISDLDETITLNQTRMESYLSSGSTGSNNSAQQDCNVENIDVTVHKHINEEAVLITSETPSQSYWQNLAEQRRLTLQEALLENEMLTDQVNVLETENSLIKSALEAAEELLKMEGLWD